MIDTLEHLWVARGIVICCQTMMLDTQKHPWASWDQITAVVDTWSLREKLDVFQSEMTVSIAFVGTWKCNTTYRVYQ